MFFKKQEKTLDELFWHEEDLRLQERIANLPKREKLFFNADIPLFPFKKAEYVGTQSFVAEEDSSVRYLFYADQTVINDLYQIINSLCRMIDTVTQPTVVRFDYSNIRAVNDIYSVLPEHYAWMYLNPLTNTGKQPKYFATIELKAGLEQQRHMTIKELDEFLKLHPSPEQSFAKLDYLIDGRLGKARLSMWSKPYFYVAYYKLIAGELSLSKLTRTGDSGKTEILFRSE